MRKIISSPFKLTRVTLKIRIEILQHDTTQLKIANIHNDKISKSRYILVKKYTVFLNDYNLSNENIT